MSARTAVRSVARGLLRRLPDETLRRGAQLRDRSRSVSVVVTVTDDNAAFLADCLGALEAQPLSALDVLVVSGVSSPLSRASVDAATSGRWRVRVLDRPEAATGDGVLEGARRATGEFLVLCDAGDPVAEGALTGLVDAAVAASADVAGATDLDLGRAGLADLVVRRSLWDRVAAEVADSAEPARDWATAARVLLAAAHPVAGPGPLRAGPRRGTGVAFGTMPVLSVHVRAWWSDVETVLARVGEGAARDRFLDWLTDEETPRYLEDAERCTPEEWATLVAAARRLTEERGPADRAGVESRVRLWLAAHDRRGDLEQLNAARWLETGFPTEVHGERVLAVLPVPDDVPEEVLELAPQETPLVAELRRARWADREAGLLELELFAFVRRVGPGDATVDLVGPGDRRVPARVERHHAPEVDAASNDPFVDQSAGVLSVVVAVADLLDRAVPGDRWRLEITVEAGQVRRAGGLTGAFLRGSARALAERDGLTLVPRRDGDGWALVVERAAAPAPGAGEPWTVDEVRLDGADLLVRGSGPAPVPAGVVLELLGPATVAADAVVDGTRWEARLRLAHDAWGLGERPLPVGGYRLGVRADGTTAPVQVGSALVAALPLQQLSEVFRLHVERALDGTLLVRLAAPLADDEVGASAQTGLRRWYASDEHRLDPRAVLLQSYTGHVATDSPRAIAEALRRMRPDLTLRWAVADSSTVVPAGVHPVQLRSRAWYDALATSGHLVTNIDMERWFEKRPGQRLLQTFHGYPSKTMGIAAWEAKNFTRLRVERQLRRTSGTWDLLLTPTPRWTSTTVASTATTARSSRRATPATTCWSDPTPARSADAPGSGSASARERARCSTHRPGATTWPRTSARPRWATSFDAAAVAGALGGDYTVLLRGHRFHRRRDGAGDSVVDVSDYPEVNDLLLAADAAVLDYSSMRFDLALLGVPMVFLVPDLDRYVRGFLYDFRSSAPGPLVASTAEVVEELRDLDGLAARHAAELDRFNATFNARQDGHAAERVVREFFGEAGSAAGTPSADV